MLEEHLNNFSSISNTSGICPHTLRNYASDLEQFRDHLLMIEKRETFRSSDIDRLTIREWMASAARR